MTFMPLPEPGEPDLISPIPVEEQMLVPEPEIDENGDPEDERLDRAQLPDVAP